MRPKCPGLDDDSASRLLQGAVHPDDAPPGYGSVAELLTAAAGLQVASVDEDAAGPTVSAMVEALRDAAPTPATPQRRSMLGKLFAGKAVAAVAAVALTASGAAAATGTLPDPVQGVVADAASHVGVDLPHPNHGKSAAHRQDGNHKPSGSDEADHQGDHGKGETISGITHREDLDGQPKGPTVCAEASNGQCKAGLNQDEDGSDDEATPNGAKNENRGRHSGDAGDDEASDDESSDDEDSDPAAPGPKAGIDTAEDRSGREIPSGPGKPADAG